MSSSHSSSSVHVSPLKVYFAVFFTLLVLTAATVAVAFVDLGVFNTPLALIIASFKATVVALFFMHLKYSERLVKLWAAAAVVWFFIMVMVTMMDYLSRYPVEGWNWY